MLPRRKEIMSKLSFLPAVIAVFGVAPVCGAADRQFRPCPRAAGTFHVGGLFELPPGRSVTEILDEKQPVAGADLIVLSEHVDYWDSLGWKDPFSSPQYHRASRTTQTATNSTAFTHRSSWSTAATVSSAAMAARRRAIQKAIRERKIPIAISNVARNGSQVTARIELPADENFRGRRGILYVALADNRQESRVAHGENGGRTLAHVAVTRVLKQVGPIAFDAVPPKKSPFPFQRDQLPDCGSSCSFKTPSPATCLG